MNGTPATATATGAPPRRTEGPQGGIPFAKRRAVPRGDRAIPTGCQGARSPGLQARGVVTEASSTPAAPSNNLAHHCASKSISQT